LPWQAAARARLNRRRREWLGHDPERIEKERRSKQRNAGPGRKRQADDRGECKDLGDHEHHSWTGKNGCSTLHPSPVRFGTRTKLAGQILLRKSPINIDQDGL